MLNLFRKSKNHTTCSGDCGIVIKLDDYEPCKPNNHLKGPCRVISLDTLVLNYIYTPNEKEPRFIQSLCNVWNYSMKVFMEEDEEDV